MLSNTIIQNTIEALSSVTRTEYIVYDDCGHVIATTTDGERLKEEDIVDEMLGILEDRNRIRQKKEMEYYQSKINEMYAYGFEEEDFEE